MARELGINVHVDVIDVDDPATAERLRFLGSPTIRIDGHDVEPGAEQRGTYAITCRVYHTEQGTSGLPDPVWVRKALMAPR